MDKSIITRELQILLEAINEQFEIIREYEDFIPQIEFDMIMENVRKLYETFHRLQRLNDPLLFVEKKISGPGDFKSYVTQTTGTSTLAREDTRQEPMGATWEDWPRKPLTETGKEPLSEPLTETRQDSFREPLTEPIEEMPGEHLAEAREEVVQEPLKETPPGHHQETMKSSGEQPPQSTVEPLQENTRIRPVVKKETPSKRPPKAAELELFATEEPVFNIKLKEAREKSLGPKIPRNESLKASIGINDKFMFINELFDGNLREYNESIETLSGFKALPQAQEYLDLLRRRNNWNSSLNAFKRIKELVEKRY